MARKSQANQLDALRASLNEGRVTELPLDLVEADHGQPRRTFTVASLNDLASDIAAHGVLQPITVDHTDNGWRIVMGERRWRAARIAGRATIPALLLPVTVPDGDDSSRWQLDRRLRQFAENHHREPLPPMDLAWFLRALRDDLHLTPTQIAASLKERGVREMGRAHVSNTIRLTELPELFQQAIAEGKLAPSHGKYVAMVTALGEAGFAALAHELEGGFESATDLDSRVTTQDVQDAVGEVFRMHAYPLEGPAHWRRGAVESLAAEGLPWCEDILFDLAECKSCPKRQAFTNAYGQQQVWCLDRAAFLRKQRAALTAIAAGEALAPDGVEIESESVEVYLDMSHAPAILSPGPDDDEEIPQGTVSALLNTPGVPLRDDPLPDYFVRWLRPRLVAALHAQEVDHEILFILVDRIIDSWNERIPSDIEDFVRAAAA